MRACRVGTTETSGVLPLTIPVAAACISEDIAQHDIKNKAKLVHNPKKKQA
jgi:hypothetical protein